MCSQLVVITAFTGLSYAATVGSHVVMTALYDVFAPQGKKVLTLISHLVCCIVCLLVCALTCKYVMKVYASGRFTPALRIPLWISYSFMPIGFFWTAVQYFALFIANIRNKTEVVRALMQPKEIIAGNENPEAAKYGEQV